jgi:hypothetical protein
MFDMSSKFVSIPQKNREIFFLFILICFSLFVRIVPLALITIIALFIFLGITALDFYIYVNKAAKDQNKNIKTTEFSWGFVKEKRDMMDISTLSAYLYGKDFSFYRNYLNINLEKIVILLFIFGDLVVAFKNLDVKSAGVYIAMSLFTKFVFIGYIFIGQTYKKVLVGANDTEENILEIFYSQINTMLSFFAAAFVFVFILSRYIVEIFFGSGFAPYQSSLPFIMLANMSLAVALSIYITALRLGDRLTKKISKFYSIIFFVLFVFMTVNYVDTVTYFIIGSSTLLSIFLYNFVIKKPAYIENTYNHLF